MWPRLVLVHGIGKPRCPVSQRVLGPPHPRTLLARHAVALDYELSGDYKNAKELHKQAYAELSQNVSAVRTVDLLTFWRSLSRAVRLSGEYTEAQMLAEDAYEFGTTELGLDHLATLRCGRELANAMRLEGDFAASISRPRTCSTRFSGSWA
jgi:hypothetical protein